MAVVWKEKKVVEPMACIKHYRFSCADCGQVFNLTRKDRFWHWVTCKMVQGILGGFRSATSTILRTNKKRAKNLDLDSKGL